MTDSIGVVIVSYCTADLTLTAVDSALATNVDAVTVVDNASGDDTLIRLRAVNDTRLGVIERPRNDGFGTAANVGAAATQTEMLLFLNSDAELNAHAVDRLGAESSRRGGRAIIGPRLVEPGGRIQRSAGMLPRPWDLAIRAVGLHRVGGWLRVMPLVGGRVASSRMVEEYDSAVEATQVLSTTMVSGACFAIGRTTFMELGGFDEAYFMYFEDADLCRRAAAAGVPIYYVPDAVVRHVGGASSAGNYRFGPLHARSMRQYLRGRYGVAGSIFALCILWLRAVGLSMFRRHRADVGWRALRAAVRDEDPRTG